MVQDFCLPHKFKNKYGVLPVSCAIRIFTPGAELMFKLNMYKDLFPFLAPHNDGAGTILFC